MTCELCDCADSTAMDGLSDECDCGCHRPHADGCDCAQCDYRRPAPPQSDCAPEIPEVFTGEHVERISRDWLRTDPGLTHFAVIGFDRVLRLWVVEVGHTASGKTMQRTDEPMIVEEVHGFNTDREASAWMREHGYR